MKESDTGKIITQALTSKMKNNSDNKVSQFKNKFPIF
jgi:hypothetical protein